MRLHELAKKHGYNQQDLLTAVQANGFDVRDTLTVIDGGVEKWVAGQAAKGWTPPPLDNKARPARKKRILVKAPSPARHPEKEPPPPPGEAPDSPARGAKKAVAPEPPESGDSGPPAPPPEVRPAPPPAPPAPAAAEPEPEKPERRAAPAAKPPAPPLKRVGVTVRGTAAVGRASPETIAAIKRNARQPGSGRAGEAEERPRPGARGGRDRQPPAGTAPRPAAGRGAAAAGPETDPAGKPIPQRRVKTRVRPGQEGEDRDLTEKKARLAKRSRPSRGWEMEELAGGEEDFSEPLPPEAIEAPEIPAEAGPDKVDIVSAESSIDRMGAGFKHKRADFKSKRITNELPAGFIEIDSEFTRSLAGAGRRRSGRRGRQRRMAGRRSHHTRRAVRPIPRVPGQAAVVRLGMTVRDLSVALGVKLQEILAFLLSQGGMAQVNDILSEDDIGKIAEKFGIPLDWDNEDDLEENLAEEERRQTLEASEGEQFERPPVVTFMGHVDHGKTSLLDAIRNTRVVDGEHGGITQHIGAYSVVKNGKRVTFLDTPGHEAFSAMRARGANLTDIAVLVVAADDGVMPQTEEAAAHARNAGVPVVIAINKCDMPAANPDRVRQELANRLNLLPEEWGGRVGMINVSAHTRQGIDELVERILLEAELLELRANPDRPATGFVVEARMSEGQGVVATLLVGDGTLQVGDVILCSNGYGKIRFMFDEFGHPIESAGPGMPIRVSGLSAVPEAGDKFFILSDLLKARAIAERREREARAASIAKRRHVTLENLTSHLAGSGKRELSVIVKADVVGSLEVIEKTLREMATPEVGINIIHAAVGGVNHADVILADASDALILGFHVGSESQARSAAASLGVQIRVYHVIYRLIEDMRAALEGLLPPEEREVVQGHVEIRQVFRSSKVGAIAGCYVLDGQIQRTNRIRLFRNQVVIYEGTIQSLRRIKDDVREVKSGFECGVKIGGYDGIEKGDVIEAFSIEEIARKL